VHDHDPTKNANDEKFGFFGRGAGVDSMMGAACAPTVASARNRVNADVTRYLIEKPLSIVRTRSFCSKGAESRPVRAPD
jgi:hypothetical protein